MYRIKKNIKNLIIIIVLIFFIKTLSKNNLTVNIINEEKHERKTLNQVLNRNKIEKSENKIIKYDFLSRYSNILDCNKNVIEKWSLDNMYTDDKQKSYAEKSPKETHNHRMLRGFLVYFPLEKKDYFIPEFKWLFRSWIEMQKTEPLLWRTDLIVFIEDSLDLLKELNCTFENKRKSDLDEPMCTLLAYTAVKKRRLKKINNTLFTNSVEDVNHEKYEYLLNNVDIFNDDQLNLLPFLTVLQQNLKTYDYLDSILIAFEGYSYFKSAGFDYLVRSDMDVFMTPLFSKWLPKYCNDFVVGGGAYSDSFNAKRLKRIANDLNLHHAGRWNLGSTWFSTPNQFRLVSYLTLFSMAYIGNEEFTLPERNGMIGTVLWPAWHYGVLLLYGQNLGMNHLIGINQINVPRLFDYIDYPTGNTNNVKVDSVNADSIIHLHCYHTEEFFFKTDFKIGKYDNMSVSVENIDKISNYCLRLALESKRKNCADLVKSLKIVINKKK